MNKTSLRCARAVTIIALAPTAVAQVPALVGGRPSLPDSALLATGGVRWAYKVQPSPTNVAISRRPPAGSEQQLVERAKAILASHSGARAIALLDGPTVIYVGLKAPAADSSLFQGASMTKTVTAWAVGQAICAGKLRLDERAADRIPELAGKALGRATVRDLLRMASGAAAPDNPGNPLTGNILTAQQFKDWESGKLDFVAVVAEDRVSAAERGIFSDFSPGEHFVYKSTDPLVLGLMINAATGVTYAEWVQRMVFDPAGVQGPGWVPQNRRGQGRADGAIRLRIEDWARLAWWARQSIGRPDCFGDYLRAASQTQIATGRKQARGKMAPTFAGYGFFIWTGSEIAPDTYWALGWGGQRIAWSQHSDRMLIAFSTLEDWTEDLLGLFRDWSAAADQASPR